MSQQDTYRVLTLIKRLEEDGETLRTLAILQKQPQFAKLLSAHEKIINAITSPTYERDLEGVFAKIFTEVRQAPHIYEIRDTEEYVINESHERTEELREALPIAATTVGKAKIQRARANREFIDGVVSSYVKNLKTEERNALRSVGQKVTETLEREPSTPVNRAVASALSKIIPNAPSKSIEKIANDKRFQEVQKSYDAPTEKEIAKQVIFSEKPKIAANTITAIFEKTEPATSPTEFTTILKTAEKLTEPLTKMTVAKNLFHALPETQKNEALIKASEEFFKSMNGPGARTLVGDIFTSAFGQNFLNETIQKSFRKNEKEIFQRGGRKHSIVGSYPIGTLQKSIENTEATASSISALSLLTTKQTGQKQLRSNFFMQTAKAAAGMTTKPFLNKSSSSFQLIAWFMIIEGKRFSDDMVPFLLKSAKSPWENTLKLGTEIAVKKGIDVVATKVAGAGLGKLLGGTLGSVFGVPGTIVGGFLGDKILQPIVSGVTGFIGGAVSMFGGGLMEWAIGLGNQPSMGYSWKKDMSVILPVLLIGFIFIPILFPGLLAMFGFSDVVFQQQSKNVWQIVMLPKGGGGNGGETPGEEFDLGNNPQARAQQKARTSGKSYPSAGPTPTPPPSCTPGSTNSCATPFCDPATGTCEWPIQGTGTITQGPNGSSTHSCNGVAGCVWNNAIDIGADLGTNVQTTHDGTVVFARNIIMNNDSSGGSYGNYIIVEGKDAKGKTYQTLYAHLEQGSIRFKAGDTVKAGTVIANIDDTGNSTGNHLHYELRAGGTSINQVLPSVVSPNQSGTSIRQ